MARGTEKRGAADALLLHGEERFLVDERARATLDQWGKDLVSDFGLDTMEGAGLAPARLQDAVLQAPFLDPYRVVHVRMVPANRAEGLAGAVQEIPGGPDARFGDYANTADRPAELPRHDGDWEAIPTTNESYGYHRMDLSHKPPEHFIRLLAKAAARGGNLLMNIGPMADGRIDPRDVAILEAIGDWMSVNGESIRGTTRTPVPVQTWGQSTRKGNRLYLQVFDRPPDRVLHVAGLTTDVTRAWLLAEPNAPPLRVRRVSPRDVQIEVPPAPTDRWVSVIVLDLAGAAAPDSVLYLPAKGQAIRLHVFDGHLFGEGIRYGDGKRGRDATQGWNVVGSGVLWSVRTIEPARYRVALEYAAAAPADTGTFTVAVGEQRLSGRVSPTVSDTLFATHDLGEIDLPAGEYLLTVRAASVEGAELMRLRRVVLTPVSRSKQG